MASTDPQQAPYITVRFAGHLAEEVGDEFRIRAWSAHEAIEGIGASTPKLTKIMSDSAELYTLTTLEGRSLDTEDLAISQDILVSPAIAGSGSTGNIVRGVAGVVLIAAGAYTGNAALIMGGVSLLGGAILNALSPKNRQGNSDDELKKSEIFNERGTAPDSDAVPRIYGKIKVNALRLNETISISDIPVEG